MGELCLSLFGAPQITLDGRPVHVTRRSAVALLAYLPSPARRSPAST